MYHSAAEVCVCTMLFSKNVRIPLKNRKIAIEIIVAGMDDENVKPTFKPRYTLDAFVK